MRLHNVGNDGWNQVVAEDSCDLGLESVDADMLIDLEKQRAQQKESPIIRTQVPKQGRRRKEDLQEDERATQSKNSLNRSSSNVTLLLSLHPREEPPSLFRSRYRSRVPDSPTSLLSSPMILAWLLDRPWKLVLPNPHRIFPVVNPKRAIPIYPSPVRAFAKRSGNGISESICQLQLSTRINESSGKRIRKQHSCM